MDQAVADDIKRKLGLRHDAEALFIVPSRFMDLRNPISDIDHLTEASQVPLILRLKSFTWFNKLKQRERGKAFRGELIFSDRKGREIKASTFQPYAWFKVFVGEVYPMVADITQFNGSLQINSPERVSPEIMGSVSTVYPAERKKVSAENVRAYIQHVYARNVRNAADLLCANLGVTPFEFKSLFSVDAERLIQELHKPSTSSNHHFALDAAVKVSVKEIVDKSERVKNRLPQKRSIILAEKPSINATAANGKPLVLTGDQDRAIDDILQDVRSGFPMMRMLSGDVGTGKTLVFAAAAAAVHREGFRVSIMTPNEPLVNQIIGQINRFFPDVQAFAVVSASKMKKADRDKFNPNHVLVGTSAIANLKDYKAHLSITDEQHKFSREQREAVCDIYTHRLDASATAIPRSMALITHGGMDVSFLKECPVDKSIITRIITRDERADVMEKVRSAVSRGKRVLIVYSLVNLTTKDKKDNKDESVDPDEVQKIDPTTVQIGYENWERKFPGLVTIAHGKMKAEEKQSAIDAITSGEKLIMVASSIAEVGLDIPDVEVCLVNRPQHYGASTLHQLRGRLVRTGGEGHMFLYPEVDISDETEERLQILVDTTDGFEIAERDMALRGFGDISEDSDVQSGASVSTFKGVKLMPKDLDFYLNNKSSPKP